MMIRLSAEGLHRVIPKVIVKGHHTINECAGGAVISRNNFDDPVCDRIDKLVIVRVEEYHAGERLKALVKGGDGFKVKVVGRFVED